MSHAFFAEMLAGGTIHNADPERGRFRFYLHDVGRVCLAMLRGCGKFTDGAWVFDQIKPFSQIIPVLRCAAILLSQ